MKSITPVVSLLLLVLITIVASVSAYFFINSNVLSLESQGNLDTYPGNDNSRLNLVSIMGSKAIVRNDGSSPVTEIVMFVNGELLNYTLDTPIQPGELREINYISQGAGEDLEIKVIYNNGKITQATSPASKNTASSGFAKSNFFEQCGEDSVIANLEDSRILTESSSIRCGCGVYGEENIMNGGFEQGNDSWIAEDEGELFIAEEGGNNYLFFNSSVSSYVSQNLNDVADFFSFDLNSSANATGYFFLVSFVLNLDEHYYIYYMRNNDLPVYSDLCDSYLNPYGYVKCFDSDANEWDTVSFDIRNDFLLYNNLSIYDYNENMSIGIHTNILSDDDFIKIDNLSMKDSTNFNYCDSENDGILDGICYMDACDKIVFNSVNYNTYNYKYDDVYFNISANYFDAPNSCTLSIEGQDYAGSIDENMIKTIVDFDAGDYDSSALMSCSYLSGSEEYPFNYSLSLGNFTQIKMIYETENQTEDLNSYCYGENTYVRFCDETQSTCYFLNSSDKGENYDLSELPYYNAPYSQSTPLISDDEEIYFLGYNNSDYPNTALSLYNSSVSEISFSLLQSIDISYITFGFFYKMAILGDNIYIGIYNGSYIAIYNSSNKGADFEKASEFYFSGPASDYGSLNIYANQDNLYVSYNYNNNIFINISNNDGLSFDDSLIIPDSAFIDEPDIIGAGINDDYFFILIEDYDIFSRDLYRVSNSDFSIEKITVENIMGADFFVYENNVYVFGIGSLAVSDDNGQTFTSLRMPLNENYESACVYNDNINLFYKSDEIIYSNYYKP
ncbi:MAG: archaellin/type IV pilin N-terminal domain-containing protein [Candidatus Nanoarchaeia archaeon]|jgi:flagellin-like protein